MILVAVSVSLALLVFFAAHYLLDREELRRLTLKAQVQDIIRALGRGEDPASWPLYRDYPHSYGFRVFDHRQAWQRKIVTEVNAELLRSVGLGSDAASADTLRDLSNGFDAAPRAGFTADQDQWLMTGRGEAGGRVFWVQAVMMDDPARRWVGVIVDEMIDHVAMPVIFIVPALTIAVYLTTRRTLGPLVRIAQQAGAIGTAVTTGQSISPLSDDKLPSEFRGAVAAINAMLATLERSLVLQKEFTSDVAHELRTPLAVLLLELSELPASAAAERLKRELSELGDLVNKLLRFAQAEDAMARQRQSLDLAGAARKVCEDMAGVAFERQKSIEFDAPAQDVIVFGHPALIDVAIRNIVDNAVKASPQHSTVSVVVDAARRVIVDDRGPGVPDEHKNRIFERFWRAERRQPGGMGIGLALVRRVALLHGGDVRVEDRPGGGARFVLTFAPSIP
jgi:signal transduction histidine kinase